uniref:Large ribosomal subunit protein uL15/eL18 domain-containing protein n=1 Tax=Catagonus wagneri TaxID=51154 RepID=A0A8C3WTV9_9CETA
MGVDFRHNKDRKCSTRGAREELGALPEATTSSTCKLAVPNRLFRSRTTRPPLSISRMIQTMKLPGREGKTAAVVGAVTDDVRAQEAPRLKVCMLQGPQVQEHQRPMHQPWLQKLTPEPALLFYLFIFSAFLGPQHVEVPRLGV